MKSIAIISSKGGVGKTGLAVALAAHWAAKQPVALIDLDTQDTGSAQWWLNRTDGNLDGLSWVKTNPENLLKSIEKLDRFTIVDTPPRLDNQAIIEIAAAVDFVLIPGKPSEMSSTAQTAKTLQAATTTPVAAVFTRTLTGTMRGAWALSAISALETIECPVVGQLREYTALARAPFEGKRPDQLQTRIKQQLNDDIEQLAANITKRINQ